MNHTQDKSNKIETTIYTVNYFKNNSQTNSFILVLLPKISNVVI